MDDPEEAARLDRLAAQNPAAPAPAAESPVVDANGPVPMSLDPSFEGNDEVQGNLKSYTDDLRASFFSCKLFNDMDDDFDSFKTLFLEKQEDAIKRGDFQPRGPVSTSSSSGAAASSSNSAGASKGNELYLDPRRNLGVQDLVAAEMRRRDFETRLHTSTQQQCIRINGDHIKNAKYDKEYGTKNTGKFETMIWSRDKHTDWLRDYCWCCGKPLWVDSKKVVSPQSEHKMPCYLMAILGLGLVNVKGRRAFPSRDCYQGQGLNMASGPLFRFKVLIRSEGMAWSHAYCNGSANKSQFMFISLRHNNDPTNPKFMYVIERPTIEKFVEDLFENGARAAAESELGQAHFMEKAARDAGKSFWGKTEKDREENKIKAEQNIYKRLIPLCCLLNQGSDIDTGMFTYCSDLLGDRKEGEPLHWREWSWLLRPDDCDPLDRTYTTQDGRRRQATSAADLPLRVECSSIVHRVWQNCIRVRAYATQKEKPLPTTPVFDLGGMSSEDLDQYPVEAANRVFRIINGFNGESSALTTEEVEELAAVQAAVASSEIDNPNPNEKRVVKTGLALDSPAQSPAKANRMRTGASGRAGRVGPRTLLSTVQEEEDAAAAAAAAEPQPIKSGMDRDGNPHQRQRKAREQRRKRLERWRARQRKEKAANAKAAAKAKKAEEEEKRQLQIQQRMQRQKSREERKKDNIGGRRKTKRKKKRKKKTKRKNKRNKKTKRRKRKKKTKKKQ